MGDIMKKSFAVFCALTSMLLFSSSQGTAETWISDSNGCKVLNQNPSPGQTITWSGKCTDGYADGNGVVVWLKDGKPMSRYKGDYAKGKRTGKGVFTYANGDRYEGNFADDKRAGKGSYTYTNGNHFEGDFVFAELFNGFEYDDNGTVVATYVDGEKKIGQQGMLPPVETVSKGTKSKGTLTFNDGSHYEGDLIDGRIQDGKGIFTYKDGSRYEGVWVNGLWSGNGSITWSDGTHYEGEVAYGKITGKGSKTFPTGDRYEGNLINDWIDRKSTRLNS